MAEEITYIPYGQNEISQQDLMTNLANGLPSFMQQYKWLQKPKNQEKFLKAYDDITKNLTGATDSSGRWIINVNNIDIDGMSHKDREIYEHAAYYIQQQMSQMTSRAKEEEKKKEDLTPFKFTTDFNKYLLKGYGNSGEIFADPEQGWDAQDARGSNGLRGTEKRRAAMIKALQEYSDSLEDNKYNFEGTQFTDLADAKAKIQTAISALRDTPNDESDDLPAFSALGLKYRSYFSNGGNDPYTKGDYSGTYQGYNDYLAEQEQAKQKAEQEKLKAQKANQYDNYKYYNFLNGTPSNAQDFEGIVGKLSNQQALDGNDISRISWAFRQAEKAGGLVNLSKEELAKMPRYASTPGRLKKLQSGLDGIYYDTFSKRLIQPQKDSQQQGVTLQSILDQNNPELQKQKQQGTPISKEGWNSADTADVISMIGDLVSLGGFWANIGGTVISLTSDLYADITREKDLGDILKGVGVNLGWGLAGMLPGAKSTKVVARAARLVPKAVMLYQSYNTVTDPEVIKSAMKFTSTEGIKTVSSKDLENLKYLFHAVTGGTNIAKSHYRAKQYKETINKQSVKTADGKTVKLSDKEIAEVNKAGRKGGQKAAQDKFKEYAKSEAAEGQFKFSENGKSKFNPTRYSSILSKFTSDNKQLKGKQIIDTEQLNNLLQEDKNRSWYHWNKGYPRFELTPFRNIFRKDFDNSKLISSASGEGSPYARKPLEQKKIQETNHIEGFPDKSTARESSFNRAIMNRYRKVMEGKFSNKEMQGGKESIKIGNEDVRVYTSKDAKGNNSVFNVTVSGKSPYFKTQEEAKKFIANIVKQQKNNITSGKITKENIKEIGKVLQNLKRKGWLKQGGQINSSLDTIIEDFIKNNNI